MAATAKLLIEKTRGCGVILQVRGRKRERGNQDIPNRLSSAQSLFLWLVSSLVGVIRCLEFGVADDDAERFHSLGACFFSANSLFVCQVFVSLGVYSCCWRMDLVPIAAERC